MTAFHTLAGQGNHTGLCQHVKRKSILSSDKGQRYSLLIQYLIYMKQYWPDQGEPERAVKTAAST